MFTISHYLLTDAAMKINRKQTAAYLLSLFFTLGFNVDASIVQLNSASSYGLLAKTNIFNTGLTEVHADLGLDSAGGLHGFPPGIVHGDTDINNDATQLALDDAHLAYDALAAFSYTQDLTGLNLARTLNPGIYNFDVTAALTGDLTLDGDGDYVFQIGTTFGISTASKIILINGASEQNIFFNIGSSSTIGAGAVLKGTFIAQTQINSGAGVDLDGRFIALTDGMTINSNNVSPIPEPPTSLLLGIGGLMLIARRKGA
jgi:type VI secretion system secreted protein VgrG